MCVGIKIQTAEIIFEKPTLINLSRQTRKENIDYVVKSYSKSIFIMINLAQDKQYRDTQWESNSRDMDCIICDLS